jgi:hypothetical protein
MIPVEPTGLRVGRFQCRKAYHGWSSPLALPDEGSLIDQFYKIVDEGKQCSIIDLFPYDLE